MAEYLTSYSGRIVGPRMIRRFQLQPSFMSHNSDERPHLRELTEGVQGLAQIIGEVVPEGRDQELALTALEEVLWRATRSFDG